MLRLSYFSKSRKGLSLVEMLVTVFIFGIIITIISTALVQGFMTGRLNSSATKDINRELNAATGLISQKMIGANYHALVGAGTTDDIYGFKVIGGNILAIASSGTPNQCTFFGMHDNALFMKQNDCNSIPALSALDQKITTGITKIIGFELSGYSYNSSNPTIAPYVTVKITGKDTNRTNAQVTLEQTYSLNYPYEQNW